MKNVCALFLLTTLSCSGLALAHDKGPCKQYFGTCKSQGEKGKAMFECVKKAAGDANDQACLDALKKHAGHHKGGKKDAEGDKGAEGQESGAKE
jgi:hypothetical protein